LAKLQYSIFCLSLIFIFSVSAHAADGFNYKENTFINYWSCLGIYPGEHLKDGEKVWIFSTDQAPEIAKVDHLIRAAVAKERFDALGFSKVYDNKPLWAEIGCVHSFRGDMPESLSRYSPEPKESSSIGYAVRGLPDSAWIAGGDNKSVVINFNEIPYVDVVRPLVTDACFTPDSLIREKQYPILSKGGAIIQVDIGKVKRVSLEVKKQKIEEEMQMLERIHAGTQYKKEKMEEMEKTDFFESVEICRFYLYKNRVLRSEKISRTTGEDERVDTAPDLDSDNWADTLTSATGFISFNQGIDWDVLFTNYGYEGINYFIGSLNGSVEHYTRSLYTYH